jgi:uncharacterized membrane protein YqjE
LDIIQRLRSISKALITQLELHGQLFHIEWELEKNRLQQSLMMVLLGFMCLLGVFVSLSTLVLALTWATEYRIPAIFALIIFYSGGLILCSFRLHKLTAQGISTFSATRKEITEDVALLRSQL